MHWNIIPRHCTDPLPKDAIWGIDRALIESVILSDDMLAEVRSAFSVELRRLTAEQGINPSFG